MAQIDKTKEEFIEEIDQLNKRIAKLESEHKQQQQQQQQQQTQGKHIMLSQAVESASDDIVLADLNGNVIYMNMSAVKTFGYFPEEITKLHVTQFPSDPQVSLNIIEELKIKNKWNGEVQFIRKNKELFVGEIIVSLLKDGNGKPIGLMSISRDITKRKEAEQELKEKIQNLDKMNNLMIDRELRVIDIKKEVNKLCRELGRPEKYGVG